MALFVACTKDVGVDHVSDFSRKVEEAERLGLYDGHLLR
jgi:hypothetical protein